MTNWTANPAEVLRGIARAWARETGRQVDEDSYDRASAHLGQRGYSLNGFVNPVRCAAEAVRAMYDGAVDHESFERIAVNRGHTSPEILGVGFIVRGYEDLQKLCDLGNFVIVMGGDGVVRAFEPDEFGGRPN